MPSHLSEGVLNKQFHLRPLQAGILLNDVSHQLIQGHYFQFQLSAGKPAVCHKASFIVLLGSSHRPCAKK